MEQTTPETERVSLAVPIAIIIAGGFIALAVYFTGGVSAPTPQQAAQQQQHIQVPPVTAADHILGNPDATLMVIEYSDLDCPFCKQFHVTMKQIMAEYGPSGQVAWVYRNFPLEQLHPNAPKLAEAAECVAELGGNDAYWKFLDEMFAAAPGNAQTDVTKLPNYAAKVGVPSAAFTECYQSGRHREKIQQQFNDAVASGGQGTPHNIIVTKSGKTVPIPGAQPYATVKSIIDTLLAE